MPDCMQISVAPKSTASRTRRSNSSWSCSYASGERRPWPKPQKAQPTMQTFETLMLRLTTKVTTSPFSSARSSSAAWRMSSIASGRVSANIAVSSSSVSALAHPLDPPGARLGNPRGQPAPRQRPPPAPLGDSPRHEVALDRPLFTAPRATTRDEAPVLDLDGVEDALLHPVRVHVLRVDAKPFGEGVFGTQPAAHAMNRRKRVLRGDVISIRRQPAQIGRAFSYQVHPPVGEVWRDLDPNSGQQFLARAHQHPHV